MVAVLLHLSETGQIAQHHINAARADHKDVFIPPTICSKICLGRACR
ncbi:hypothetical protein HHE02_05300 [Helicobacter heilmannii]|uniref:Uncharacterized protein n=1 Tax=Helicobacter heilmannii TaxID=35817 RepID=A0A0K2YCA3_HELHE|nr:hypothetical protein BN341_10420 [Helicobacter heilmannii ASB1.4]CRF47243.1 hypothetical protein HHE02_05300 [Helicobacter heilmannii]CRF49321.1 hypothetical protein HHE03_09280 [Helicobacter heilmannii]CRI34610.1 hypothetical protein HHE01_04110 [Helicobacter heilmannii]